jgi:hypothetical protein
MAVRTMTSGELSATFTVSTVSRLTGVLALLVEHLVDLVTDFAVGELDVVLGGAVVGHEGEEAVVGNVNLRCMLS